MKYFRNLVIPIILTSLVLGGCSKKDVPVSVVEEDNRTAVEVMNMETGNIQSNLVYAGKVQPNKTVSVTSKLSGQVNEIYYDVGDYVNQGDVLFRLDEKDLRDNIKNLQSQLQVANANVKTAQTRLAQVNGGQSESTKLQLQTAIDNAKANLDNYQISLQDSQNTLNDTEKKYNNTKSLYDSGVVAKNDFDSVELAYNQAKNSHEKLLNSIAQAQMTYDQAVEAYNIYVNQTTQDSLDTAKDGVNSALASKQSIETQIRIAQETLNDTSVKSPISGIISEKNINESNMVSAQLAPFTIVDMSVVTVDVNISEKLINLISIGQQVDVVIPTISKDVIKGRIKNITPAAGNTSMYPVKIEIDNANGDIKPGMFAEIHFIEKQNQNALAVPRNTVIEGETDKFVYIVKDGKAIKTVVTTGIDNGEEIEILSGVNIGDQVVVKGQSYLSDQEDVRIVTENSENQETTNQDTTAKEE